MNRELLDKAKKWLKRITIFFFASTVFVVVLYRFIDPPLTPLMLIRVFEQWGDGKSARMKKNWVDLDEMSPNMYRAVMASEDQLFLEHHGFDFEAIQKALKFNQSKSKRRNVKGASTISQQTAKNVFLWPGRSWLRKGLEVYFTVLIEIFWSKERIMEVYLNVIETGDGIYGADAAAHYYFHSSAKNISKSNAALIAAVLPNPRKCSAKHPTSYILGRKTWIMRNMDYLAKVKLEE